MNGHIITFYTGPMFSSKTEATDTHIARLEKNDLTYLLLTPEVDDRAKDAVKTHNGKEIPAVTMSKDDSLIAILENYTREHKGALPDFVIKDEVGFFTSRQVHEYVGCVETGLFHGIMNGLVYDWKADPFVFIDPINDARFMNTEDLLGADVVMPVLRHAICNCGQVGWHTYDRLHGKDADGQVKIGGDERYEAMCTPCYSKSLIKLGINPLEKKLDFYKQK